MAHITIEYSANIALEHDIDALVHTVHAAALDHGLASLDGLRTRAVAREHYEIGDGGDDLGFVAIVARIGPGRDERAKASFVAALIDAAEEALVADHDGLAIAFSAEIQEIDPAFRINRNHVRTRLAQREGDR